ncbi:hypothetical protein [Candidatus Williamhamiltonella defendens]|uniref:hypothetical protein n=1 Tax=Candidatus Williamhamiltonella defendens TaxID=138072 RepID=UPI001F21A7DF|nr:hypothetical protein [Candidatus Hamiltonella defensa]
MTDILLIRLREKVDQSVHWIYYSVNDDLIKDYGKLNPFSKRAELSAVFLISNMQVLLPGQQVLIQSCILPDESLLNIVNQSAAQAGMEIIKM